MLFYLAFGLLPMLIISYYSFLTASKSLSKTTEKQLTELVERVSQQTLSSYSRTKDDIFQLSQNPIIQLSFLQFSYGQRMETLQNRLGQHRVNAGYERITLYTHDGRIVMTNPQNDSMDLLNRAEIVDAFNNDFSVNQIIIGKSKKLVFFKKVYDFEDETVPVGMLVYEANLTSFTTFVANINIGKGIHKLITNKDNNTIFVDRGWRIDQNVFKTFSAHVPILDWDITLSVPEKILLKDIYLLKNKSIAFSLLVSVLALIAAIFFINRIMKPLRQIIRGTEKFADGDLSHRINMSRGKEIKLLSDAFDHMAESLHERQKELVQANKLASLGLMSAGIAHEIRNPLAGIKTSVQVLMKRVRTETSKNLSSGILEEVDRLNKIVTDLLDFSKPGPSNRIDYPLNKIITYCLQLMNKDLKDKNVTVIDKVGDQTINVDPAQMRQIVMNILLNSLVAVDSESGVITLIDGTEEETGAVTLTVQDNGKGIPQDRIDQIFDPFFSLSSGGTGLGLSVVFTLLQQNRIRHQVQSKENIGTTFMLIFENKDG